MQFKGYSRTPTYTLMSKCSFFVDSISVPLFVGKAYYCHEQRC